MNKAMTKHMHEIGDLLHMWWTSCLRSGTRDETKHMPFETYAACRKHMVISCICVGQAVSGRAYGMRSHPTKHMQLVENICMRSPYQHKLTLQLYATHIRPHLFQPCSAGPCILLPLHLHLPGKVYLLC